MTLEVLALLIGLTVSLLCLLSLSSAENAYTRRQYGKNLSELDTSQVQELARQIVAERDRRDRLPRCPTSSDKDV